MYHSKDFKNDNYFVLYDLNDNIVCYFDNFNELSRYINYSSRKLKYEFSFRNSNIITIIIDNQKMKLATFC